MAREPIFVTDAESIQGPEDYVRLAREVLAAVGTRTTFEIACARVEGRYRLSLEAPGMKLEADLAADTDYADGEAFAELLDRALQPEGKRLEAGSLGGQELAFWLAAPAGERQAAPVTPSAPPGRPPADVERLLALLESDGWHEGELIPCDRLDPFGKEARVRAGLAVARWALPRWEKKLRGARPISKVHDALDAWLVDGKSAPLRKALDAGTRAHEEAEGPDRALDAAELVLRVADGALHDGDEALEAVDMAQDAFPREREALFDAIRAELVAWAHACWREGRGLSRE